MRQLTVLVRDRERGEIIRMRERDEPVKLRVCRACGRAGETSDDRPHCAA